MCVHVLYTYIFTHSYTTALIYFIFHSKNNIYFSVSGEFRIKPVPHKPFPHMRNWPNSVYGIGQIVTSVL